MIICRHMNTFYQIIKTNVQTTKKHYVVANFAKHFDGLPNAMFDMWTQAHNDVLDPVKPDYLLNHILYQYITSGFYAGVSIPAIPVLHSSLSISIKTKFEYIRATLNNPFFTDDFKADFLDRFSKAQRTYHTLARFAFRFRFRNAETKINHDVYLNPLELSMTNVIVLYQNHKNYLFSLSDLINLSNNALSNSSYFFSDPLVVKNPYNNMPFSKSMLYSIYFALKKSTYVMPILFHLYFLENFNLQQFKDANEVFIREYIIKKHVTNSATNVLFHNICIMFLQTRHAKKIVVDANFPKQLLIDIMRPYLYLYYSSMYSMIPHIKHRHSIEFHYKITKFIEYNPNFGRKKVCMVPGGNGRKQVSTVFNSDHLSYDSFSKIGAVCDVDFMADHLTNETGHHMEFERAYHAEFHSSYDSSEDSDSLSVSVSDEEIIEDTNNESDETIVEGSSVWTEFVTSNGLSEVTSREVSISEGTILDNESDNDVGF